MFHKLSVTFILEHVSQYFILYIFSTIGLVFFFHLAEDWTGAINYYRNLPFSRVCASEDSPVDVPCLLIIGNQDSSVQLESVVRSAEYLSNYQLKIIDSVGHFPHQERPAEVNSLLLSFLISKYNSIVIFVYNGSKRLGKGLLKILRKGNENSASLMPTH